MADLAWMGSHFSRWSHREFILLSILPVLAALSDRWIDPLFRQVTPTGDVVQGWDNAPHHPGVSTAPHHHPGAGAVEASAVRSLRDVLELLTAQLT
jgi:hypothetical protein